MTYANYKTCICHGKYSKHRYALPMANAVIAICICHGLRTCISHGKYNNKKVHFPWMVHRKKVVFAMVHAMLPSANNRQRLAFAVAKSKGKQLRFEEALVL